MKEYRFLLFDLDGTVSESAPGIIRAVRYSLSALGIEENDPQVLQSFIGPPLNVQYKKVYHFTHEQIVTAVTKFRELYETEGILDCRPYPGLDRLFREALADHRILAVASSKPEPFVKQILENFGFAPYFSVICGSEVGDELEKKDETSPKARIIRKVFRCLAEAGFSSREIEENALMIGDTAYDIHGAKTMHLPSVGVTYGYGSRQELEEAGADALADSPESLRELLLGGEQK